MLQKLRNLPKIVRQELRRSLVTTQPVIIQKIDRDTMRCTVAHKDDNQVLATDCPLATTYAVDGAGQIPPLDPPVDAIAFGSTYRLRTILSRRGFVDSLAPRHSVDDLIVMPMVWFDGDDIPDHAPGEWVFAHEAGSSFRMTPDGGLTFAGATGEAISLPDEADTAADQTHGVGLGDPANKRVDPATGEDTGEDVSPILDPTDDTETTYENPTAIRPQGPVDAGFYETRHFVFPRRVADPDVTVTDETADAYIDVPQAWRDAGRLPPGYVYLNVTTGALMVTDMTGVPVELQAL